MDLDRPVIYRNLDINDLRPLKPATPLDGYVVNEARFLPVEGWGYREKRSLDDGYDVSEVFLGMRNLMLRGTVYALNKADLHDRVRVLRALLTPTLAYGDNPNDKGFLPLYFDVPTKNTTDWPSGIIALSLYVRPRSQPSFFFVRETAFGRSEKGFSIPYECDLEARDPLFYHPIARSAPLTASGGGGVVNGTFQNRGDYPAKVVFELHAPAGQAALRRFTFNGGGTSMVVTVPGEAKNRVVRVDSYDKVVTYTEAGDQSLRMDLIDFAAGKTWPKIDPGDSDYNYSVTGGALGAASQMVWRETFV